MKYRLALDIGTNSLGGAIVRLENDGAGGLEARDLVHLFARIFSDARNPKDKSSNAAQRRGPRGMRRNRDRKLMRKEALMRALVHFGLMPSDKSARKALEAHDPWILRYRALDEELPPHHIGRALFHLHQRRGFKSNRKTDGDGDGAMFDAIEKAQRLMAEKDARTLGELFGRDRLTQFEINQDSAKGTREPLPQARVKASAQGAKMVYDYYPDRAMILDEFDQIWATQARYHPALMTDEARDHLRAVMSFQRPLRPQQAGKCTFIEGEPRAPKALPSAQYAKILQEVNNLRIGARGDNARVLTDDERAQLIDFLRRPSNKTGKRTFKAMRKLLSLPESQKFSHESRKRDHLVGDATAARLMQPDSYGPEWFDLSLEQQDTLVDKLLESEQFDDYMRGQEAVEGFGPFVMREYGLDEARARAVFKTRLPDAHGKLSKAALDRIIPHLEEGLLYSEAAREEFKDHRALGDGVIYEDGLPYYGEVLSRHTAFEKDNPKNDEERYGRVANPTVHVALNQLQKVINDIIKRWGPPTQVVLELARDLPLSDRGLRDLESRQDKNQKANEERNKWLEEHGHTPSYENRLKLRLYEEALECFGGVAVCVFTGKTISKTDVFTDQVEVEHILPLSRTLDDSLSNKVLSLREANRKKGNKTPANAFSHSPDGFNWEDIGQRAADLPASKAWRFAPDAMAQWEARGGDFLARQLNDTRYIARLGKSFVEGLFGGQGSKDQARQVWVVPGQLTSDLRHFAGFNTLTGLTGGNHKDRTDHRHHAVDALVIALIDQGMVKRAADLAKREDRVAHYEIMQAMAEPLKRYRRAAEDRLSKLVVSHKPDHGFQDAMHNDTAYGLTGETDAKGNAVLVTRKPLDSLNAKQLATIADPELRDHFIAVTNGLSGKAFTEALVTAGKDMRPQVFSVRMHTPMKPSSFVVIRHGKNKEHAKAYKGDGNYCYDIWVDEKGKWTGEVITSFQAYQMARQDKEWWRKSVGLNGQKLIMRIRKGDMLEIDAPAGRQIAVVYKFTSGRIYLAEHFQANASARIRAKDIPENCKAPSALQKANAVRITVSPSGRVRRHKV